MNVDIIPIPIREWCDEVVGLVQNGVASDAQCLFIIEDRIDVLKDLETLFTPTDSEDEWLAWKEEQRDLERIARNLRNLGIEPKPVAISKEG